MAWSLNSLIFPHEKQFLHIHHRHHHCHCYLCSCHQLCFFNFAYFLLHSIFISMSLLYFISIFCILLSLLIFVHPLFSFLLFCSYFSTTKFARSHSSTPSQHPPELSAHDSSTKLDFPKPAISWH